VPSLTSKDRAALATLAAASSETIAKAFFMGSSSFLNLLLQGHLELSCLGADRTAWHR
jgi:hypothetical protein